MTLRQTSAQVSASFVKTLSFLTLPCAVTTDPTRFGHLTSFYSANFLIESCQVGWCVHFELKCTPADCFLYDFYRQKFYYSTALILPWFTWCENKRQGILLRSRFWNFKKKYYKFFRYDRWVLWDSFEALLENSYIWCLKILRSNLWFEQIES